MGIRRQPVRENLRTYPQIHPEAEMIGELYVWQGDKLVRYECGKPVFVRRMTDKEFEQTFGYPRSDPRISN